MMPAADMSGISERRVASNGIHLNIAEQKPVTANGKLVVMLHGFPESWYSWRHQFAPLAAAGYHAVATDMRGYGKSDKPAEISAYNQVEVMRDIAELVPALGYETAIVLGHDWGAPTAWGCAANYPDIFTAVGVLSVPYSPRADVPPLDMMKEVFKGQFFYQLYFQEPGVAEAEFEADIRTALAKFLVMGAGETDLTSLPAKKVDDDLLSSLPVPDKLPQWLREEDLDFYTAEFTRSTFRGPINYYRNHNLTWQLTEGSPNEILQPAMFVAGDKDGVIMMAAQALQDMPNRVKDLRINRLLPGIGHWTQQEAPDAVNEAITEFLAGLN